jgi:excisionase family DNA binding protein
MSHPTAALYVRLPHPEFDKLERAAEALSTNKKTLVTTLVAQYVDPDSPGGLVALRESLQSVTPGRVSALRSKLDAAAPGRRVTVELPEEGMTVGHHAFTPNPAPDVLTPAQAAELLQVTEDEVLELAKAGALPGRQIGEHWRFSRPALIAWLAGGE